MFFGSMNLAEAEGTILAHSLKAGNVKIKKGSTLTASDIDAIREAGITRITVAKLEAGDIDESLAAQKLGDAVASPSIQARAPFAGRVNLFAQSTGLLDYDEAVLQAVNSVDEAICVALKAPMSQVKKGQMIGTIKIIPYAVPRGVIENAMQRAAKIDLRVNAFLPKKISLILTKSDDMSDHLIAKGEQAIATRLAAFGAEIGEVQIVAHQRCALSQAINQAQGEMILILTAQATADRRDDF